LCAQHPEAAAYFPSFFYAQKTPRSERDAGLGHNPHPTPKPLDLGRWLTRLIARPGQTVVDPFMGTGGLCAAALLEGCRVVGIELEDATLDLARRHIPALVADAS
jgi:site-specific DNA-methyltransferase (adenine-specific)